MRVPTPGRARPPVRGAAVDAQTRCVHYGTLLDVVAIRFACCDEYYPCRLCHDGAVGHPTTTWPASDRDRHVVMCGVCSAELTIAEYRGTESCPACRTAFNPGCSLHDHLYFDPDPAVEDICEPPGPVSPRERPAPPRSRASSREP